LFVFFYCSNSFVTLYGIFIPEKIPRLEVITAILSSSYPTICPFFLVKNNKIVSLLTSFLSMLRCICSQRAFRGWSDTPQFLGNRRESLIMYMTKEISVAFTVIDAVVVWVQTCCKFWIFILSLRMNKRYIHILMFFFLITYLTFGKWIYFTYIIELILF
jgi:hypothetical protein